MGNRATEEHKLWLFDLAHGNLSEVRMVRGFLKFYALEGYPLQNVVDDLVFRTHYGPERAGQAADDLRAALEKAADGKTAMGTEEKDV